MGTLVKFGTQSCGTVPGQNNSSVILGKVENENGSFYLAIIQPKNYPEISTRIDFRAYCNSQGKF